MFEVVVTACLSLAAQGAEPACRDMLLAGYEASTPAQCEAQLPALAKSYESPRCEPVGRALETTEVAPGVYAHLGQIEEPDTQNHGDVANLGFIVGADSVAVIDTGSARWIGEALWRAIRQNTDKPVSHVILTHMHPDHVSGTDAFSTTGAQVVSHAALPRALADRQANYAESLTRLIGPAFAGSTMPEVNITVPPDAPMQIDLGGRILTLHAWPTAHTGNDLTVLDETTGTLFTGDLVFHIHTPALDGSVLGWLDVLDQLQEWDIARIVPGHGGPVLDWPEGAKDQRRYLETLRDDTRAAISNGTRLGEAVTTIADSEADKWKLFEAYNPRNATVAFTELEWE
ncbi:MULTISPECIES: quinoprotein relay system zinc metallohydrolase 2 [unclassified Roseovarius]|uniref:quinoprotein relay system zinc metallohydrolase 2 n=1 Tax=unclassified Roseovarius TaxID=2614913 RepID=UPI00273F4BF0|nr:quinoprotein relay system zinc metallohydrolase 2 [Roseovarius sp. MMSF_3350]